MVQHRGSEITSIPAKRADEYARWRRLLDEEDADAERRIHKAINAYVDGRAAEGTPVFCSSWIPGANWDGTPYQPIYDAIWTALGAVEESQALAFDESRKFFGLIVLDVMILRDDEWECWHEAHQWDEEPLGMFYRLKAA